MNKGVQILLGVFLASTSINIFATTSDDGYPKKVGQYFKLFDDSGKKKIEIAVVNATNEIPRKTIGEYENLSGESVNFDKCGPMQVLDNSKLLNPLSQKTVAIKVWSSAGVTDGCPISEEATLKLAP